MDDGFHIPKCDVHDLPAFIEQEENVGSYRDRGHFTPGSRAHPVGRIRVRLRSNHRPVMTRINWACQLPRHDTMLGQLSLQVDIHQKVLVVHGDFNEVPFFEGSQALFLADIHRNEPGLPLVGPDTGLITADYLHHPEHRSIAGNALRRGIPLPCQDRRTQARG